MTRISILYFAAVKELVGKSSEEVELPDSVRDVKSFAVWLELERPRLRGALKGVRFAVGEEFASLERRLAPGDTVAVLPPVSGG